jgi:hypothetical protein
MSAQASAKKATNLSIRADLLAARVRQIFA